MLSYILIRMLDKKFDYFKIVSVIFIFISIIGSFTVVSGNNLEKSDMSKEELQELREDRQERELQIEFKKLEREVIKKHTHLKNKYKIILDKTNNSFDTVEELNEMVGYYINKAREVRNKDIKLGIYTLNITKEILTKMEKEINLAYNKTYNKLSIDSRKEQLISKYVDLNNKIKKMEEGKLNLIYLNYKMEEIKREIKNTDNSNIKKLKHINNELDHLNKRIEQVINWRMEYSTTKGKFKKATHYEKLSQYQIQTVEGILSKSRYMIQNGHIHEAHKYLDIGRDKLNNYIN